MWTLSMPKDYANRGNPRDPDEGYGPNDGGAPRISKKQNSITNLCLSKSKALKTFNYKCMHHDYE